MAGYNEGPNVGTAGTLANSPFSTSGQIINDSDGTSIHVGTGSSYFTLGYYNSSGQELSSAQLNNDGSEVDTLFNTSGGLMVSTVNSYNTSNSFTQTAWNFTDGNQFVGPAGSASDVAFNSSTNILTANLTAADGAVTGVLAINEATDPTGTLTLADGVTINLTLPQTTSLTAPPTTDMPEQALVSYLGNLGDSTTASALDTLNFDDLNPSGTAYTASSSVVANPGDTSATVTYTAGGPGAVVAGASTAVIEEDIDGTETPVTVPATNILDASGDLSQDTVSGVPKLDVTGNLALTATEFNNFSSIVGSGALTITTAGTVTLAGSGDTGTFTSLTAQDWGGTSLTGSSANGQTLTASLFGTDTLTAGSGTGDILYAGEGKDTITGGTGSDTFYANNGLASGSSITGEGSGNKLVASGDISGGTVTGVQTLQSNDVTLNATELSGFSTITNTGSSFTLDANGAGTYSMASFTVSGTLYMNTDTTDSQSLIGNNQGYNQLSADDSSGVKHLTVNDTSGSTGYNTLSAQGSTGNNVLAAGAGVYDGLNVNDSVGNNTLTAGNGNNDELEAESSSGNNSLTVGNGNNDGIYVGDSSGNNTLTAGSGTGDYLDAENSSGNNTFNLSTSGGTVDALGSTGHNTFNLAGGGLVTVGAGISTVNGSTTGSDTVDVEDGLAAGSVITFHGYNDNVNIYGTESDISGATITDIEFLNIMTSGTVLMLNAGELANVSTIYAENGATLVANTAGTYSLSGIDVDAPYSGIPFSFVAAAAVNGITMAGDGDLTLANTSGNDAITAGNASFDTLDARGSTGTDTLTAGSGAGDVLYAGLGDDTLIGGTGGDDFYFTSNAGKGTTVTGGSGSNALEIGSAVTDITGATVTGVSALVDYSNSLTLTGAEFNQLTNLDNVASGTATLVIVGSGSYSLSGKSVTGTFTLITDSGTTITGNNTAGQVLYANSTGTSTVNAGSGAGDVLYAGSGNDTLNAGSGGDTLVAGTGVDTLTGGSGNDTFVVGNALASSSVLNGEGGTNGIQITAAGASLTGATISNITSLEIENGASTTLTSSQFGAFTTYTADAGSGAVNLSSAGTYSLASKTVTGALTLAATGSGTYTLTGSSTANQTLNGSTGNDTLNAGSGAGDVLYAGSGTDTLNAGSGGDTLYDGTGTATLNGGSGADTFYVSNPMGGTTVNGGSGDTVYVSGNTDTGALTDTINISGGTVYVGTDTFADIYGSDNTIVTANDTDVGTHNGTGNTVDEGGSSGVWLTDNGGSTVDAGAGDYVYVSGNGTSGVTNTVNISSGTVDIETDTQTDVYGSNDTITTGANSTAGVHNGNDNTVTEGNSSGFWMTDNGGSTVNAGSSADYVYVSGNGTSGADNTVNISNGEVAIDNDTQADVNGASNTITVGTDGVSGVNGNSNTISLGSGTYYWVNGGTGNTVTASSYDTITVGGGLGANLNGGGNDSYEFGSTFAASTIDNNYSGGLTAANGVIGFGSGVSDENLWFKQSGNNLLIDLLGTTDQITVDNWFGSNAGAQVSELDAGSLKLTTQVASLVSAMATYQSAHTGFNPQTATSMPTDTTLQNAIAASWHS